MLQGTDRGTNTDLDGFFTFANLEPGTYTLVFSYTGFGTKEETIEVKDDIEYIRVYLAPEAINLSTVDVSARREQARSDVQVSKVTVSPKEIRALPATGGEADIAQYLTVIPGIGPKTAKRIIVELKEKYVDQDDDNLDFMFVAEDGMAGDAIIALMSLGYKRRQVNQAIRQLEKAGELEGSIEEIIKKALVKI